MAEIEWHPARGRNDQSHADLGLRIRHHRQDKSSVARSPLQFEISGFTEQPSIGRKLVNLSPPASDPALRRTSGSGALFDLSYRRRVRRDSVLTACAQAWTWFCTAATSSLADPQAGILSGMRIGGAHASNSSSAPYGVDKLTYAALEATCWPTSRWTTNPSQPAHEAPFEERHYPPGEALAVRVARDGNGTCPDRR